MNRRITVTIGRGEINPIFRYIIGTEFSFPSKHVFSLAKLSVFVIYVPKGKMKIKRGKINFVSLFPKLHFS